MIAVVIASFILHPSAHSRQMASEGNIPRQHFDLICAKYLIIYNKDGAGIYCPRQQMEPPTLLAKPKGQFVFAPQMVLARIALEALSVPNYQRPLPFELTRMKTVHGLPHQSHGCNAWKLLLLEFIRFCL
ncbi:hypothetical protein GOBAR_AA25459 [Gossypium barbadense]|uniref:Uncharacterized protein n=1 Tax=Gossypium barbadense TaxID=3634 RepID=A0A2P5WVV4_GOSBA|nr:hypothetical protein GOBAR_AA25459 [Gossypium barbadense]